MRLLTIVFISLIGVAIACPHQIHKSESTKNDTENIERRWTTFDFSFRQPWPRDDDGSDFCSISYCYYDYNSWRVLKDRFDEALALWMDKLLPAAEENGHRLRVYEPQGTQFDEQPYCYEFQNGTTLGFWNTRYKDDTLVIKLTYDASKAAPGSAWATPGWAAGTRSGRHRMLVNPGKLKAKKLVTYIAHELGHVFGLSHEHQRHDRDEYLHYEPKNVKGYNAMLAEVAKQSTDTLEQVCADDRLAEKYKFFSGMAFTKQIHSVDAKTVEVTEGPFDVESIMLYCSRINLEVGKDRRNIQDVPLVKWKDSNQNPIPRERTDDNCELIPFNQKVTDLDRDGVKRLYSWNSPS